MALREILAFFDIEADDSKLKELDASVEISKKLLTDLRNAVALRYAVSGVKDFVADLVNLGAEIRHATEKTGLSAQQWQQWSYAADQSGVSADALGNAFKFLFKNADAASEGGKQAARAFAELGIDAKDSSGHFKDANTLFAEAGGAIGKIDDPVKKTALALRLFGRAGQALIPLFDRGPEGLAELNARFKELGGGIGDDALETLRKQEKAGKDLNLAWTSLTSIIADQAIPAITWLVGVGISVVQWVRETTKGTHLFEAALYVLAAASVALAGPLLLPWLPWIALVGAAILVLDALLSVFSGGEPIVGHFFKSIEKSTWFQAIERGVARAKKAIVDLGTTIRDEAASWASKLWEGIASGWDKLVNFMKEKGEALLDGLLEGLKNKWEEVKGWFMDHIPGLKAVINTASDSHSPSRMTEGPGENLIAGYALGMQNMLPTVKKQAVAAVDAGDPGNVVGPQFNNLFAPSVAGRGSSTVTNNVSHRADLTQHFHGVTPNNVSDMVRDSVLGVSADDRRAMIEDLEALGADPA